MLSRTLLFWAGLVLGASVAVAAESTLRASKAEVRKEVVAIIDAQLEAFRKQDIELAYGYFSVVLRAEKPFPIFVAIVRTSYPELLNNTRADYGIVRDNGTLATVLVHIHAKQSDASYDFTLIREQGSWRVRDVLRHAPTRQEEV